jgi:hypothetical protein
VAGPIQPSANSRPARAAIRFGVLLATLALLVLALGERRSEPAWAYPGSLVDWQRYGFIATSANWRQKFDVSQLGAGWYVDANPPACATSPGGMDRALLIRVLDWTPDRLPWLESMVDAHPGSLWLVGNEPDCIWQDNVLPEAYADIYHQIYTTIKARDPNALVSPGGIVQPTPLRLEWLDRVLEEYATRNGDALMPVDVWNIHNAILREARGDWGADIPPGFDDIDVGVLREVSDNDRLDIFTQQIWDFRAWMADRGYAGYPLIVTEFGILMPVEFGFDLTRVNTFMDGAFAFLRTATSSAPGTLGDPTDGNRLVQRWSWFSLDVPPWNPATNEGFNGNLFDPYTKTITGYGLNFRKHTAALPAPDYRDLRPGGLRFEPLGPVAEGELVNRQVEVEVRNLGNLDSGPVVVRLAYDGPASGQLQHSVTNLPAGSSTWVPFELTQLSQGAYALTVSVDPDDLISETTECDNLLTLTMVVPSDVTYLPLVARKR